MRGLRWRAAGTIVALVMVILWYTASTGRGYLLRVDFAFVPEAIGAEVVVDGEGPAGDVFVDIYWRESLI